MTWVFLLIECCLYISYMSIDLADQGWYAISSQLKFIGILFCCFYTVSLILRKKAQSRPLAVSFLFLICSDYFLLFTDSYEAGLCTFLGVQFCFFLYLHHTSGHGSIKSSSIFLTFIVMVSCGILMLLKKAGIQLNSQLILAILYFLMFTSNVVSAIVQCRQQKQINKYCFTVGLLLYFCCDILVGIFNCGDYLMVNQSFFQAVYEFSVIGMWLFYLPGIVVIALSNNEALHEKDV